MQTNSDLYSLTFPNFTLLTMCKVTFCTPATRVHCNCFVHCCALTSSAAILLLSSLYLHCISIYSGLYIDFVSFLSVDCHHLCHDGGVDITIAFFEPLEVLLPEILVSRDMHVDVVRDRVRRIERRRWVLLRRCFPYRNELHDDQINTGSCSYYHRHVLFDPRSQSSAVSWRRAPCHHTTWPGRRALRTLP